MNILEAHLGCDRTLPSESTRKQIEQWWHQNSNSTAANPPTIQRGEQYSLNSVLSIHPNHCSFFKQFSSDSTVMSNATLCVCAPQPPLVSSDAHFIFSRLLPASLRWTILPFDVQFYIFQILLLSGPFELDRLYRQRAVLFAVSRGFRQLLLGQPSFWRWIFFGQSWLGSSLV